MMPHSTENAESTAVAGIGPRRLVLCFDGTGNKFQGTEVDTNIVKIYQMLQRHTDDQFHYYQPGIGTYIKGQSKSSGKGLLSIWPHIKSTVFSAADQAIGLSFEDHVLAGYKFIMRHYCTNDHIYIFGFSRGAYTARFLAEMVQQIGLLSRGNEEMVQFAWETFSNFQNSRGNDPQTDSDRALAEYMEKFKVAFCRPGVRTHFLGLFDCVNSVGQFEIPLYRTSYNYMATPAAKHIRHAVSIHERRLKFKPALFTFDEDANVDLKEVWFAGNHADVGGGWGLEKGQKHLLSDTPLNWMVQESLNLPGSESRLSFQTLNVQDVVKAENAFPGVEVPGTTAFDVRRKVNQPHDMLKFFHGVGVLSVLLWWVLEILPIFTRLELVKGRWKPTYFPPNLGAPRDIPMEGVIHSSVPEMIKAGILDEKSIPKKGGDNPQISIANVTGEWGLMRKAAERKQSNASEDTLVNGGESGAAVVDKVEEAAAGASKKALGGVSSLLAKVRG
ncbi:putative sporulation associated protein [Neofusicoccum parvum]|uniref:Putative sporulation associated protein n=1 Tax=Botryosphaeria parva (strain UCR-NP2) TaxID=1287680 RepID=R1EIS6_BOTPV|nr:putative sporulation associated protein [Neofusicoccum parvum UCRNP2]GME60287.1 putative sporulation associated protein [Neofusicoccum parvum]